MIAIRYWEEILTIVMEMVSYLTLTVTITDYEIDDSNGLSGKSEIVRERIV